MICSLGGRENLRACKRGGFVFGADSREERL
jgi:hypothetical protein